MSEGKNPAWWRAWVMLVIPTPLLITLSIIYGVFLVFQAGGDQSVLNTILPAHIAYVILSNHTLLLGLMLWFMRLDGLQFSQIGLQKSQRWITAIGLGVVFALLLFVFKQYWLEPTIARLLSDANTFRVAPSATPLGTNLIASLVAGVIAGGVIEELVFRGYILNRLSERLSIWVSVPIMLLSFGLLHAGLGIQGMIVATIMGLFFTLMYLWHRSIITPITAHALLNILILLR